MPEVHPMLNATRCATCNRSECALIPTGDGTYICLACLDASPELLTVTAAVAMPLRLDSKACI